MREKHGQVTVVGGRVVLFLSCPLKVPKGYGGFRKVLRSVLLS